MNLIGQEDVNAASYKKAAVIMFDNTNAVPAMRVFEDTTIPGVMSQRTGEYIVPYHSDIEIPLPDEVLALLANIQTAKALSVNGLTGILYAVYGFARAYKPVAEEVVEV